MSLVQAGVFLAMRGPRGDVVVFGQYRARLLGRAQNTGKVVRARGSDEQSALERVQIDQLFFG